MKMEQWVSLSTLSPRQITTEKGFTPPDRSAINGFTAHSPDSVLCCLIKHVGVDRKVMKRKMQHQCRN